MSKMRIVMLCAGAVVAASVVVTVVVVMEQPAQDSPYGHNSPSDDAFFKGEIENSPGKTF